MKANSLNPGDLFGQPVRYVIPPFQRPYVWNQDDQWDPFWNDVQHAADRYLEELAAAGVTGPDVGAQQRAGRHFLGAVVVKQQLTPVGEPGVREVIDGQQRLITMQLLLDATEEVARENGWDDAAFQVRSLVLNDTHYAKKDADFVFKVWPTSADQAAFRAVMTDGATPKEFAGSQIAEAHSYFKDRVHDWVNRGEGADEQFVRVEALQVALLALLEVVVIDLEAADDAFVIFETLNARGTPLLQSDLIKNFLLQRAEAAGYSVEEVGARYWAQFGDPWWRDEVPQGRLRRPRVDLFLDYWLESRTGDEVASHQVFPRFKALVDEMPNSILDIAASMRDMANVYREILRLNRFTRDGTFVYRWETLDAGVLTPLLLWVFSHEPEVLAPGRKTRLLVALESYLVRRAVNRLTTQQYNILFLDALKVLVTSDPMKADDVLIEFLGSQRAESREWPSDEKFRQAFLDLPVYRLLTRGRLRMVLEALEDSLRGPKTEDEFVPRRKLTVEHVMPQAWGTNWSLPEGIDPLRAEIDRTRLVHTFGNLTLATSSLNSTIGNHSWDQKRAHLEDNSTLLMTKALLKRASEADGWNDDLIRERSGTMLEQALAIWPRHP